MCKNGFLSKWCQFNAWIKKHSESLSAWASLLQIILIPCVIFGGIIAYLQIVSFVSKADLRLDFGTPKAVRYHIENYSNTVAEDLTWGFGIFDLDTPTPFYIVPLVGQTASYVRGNSTIGPWELLGQYGQKGHRYFGFANVSCKNCEEQKWYWIYTKYGSDKESWFIELGNRDPKMWDLKALLLNSAEYIDSVCSKNRRMPIGEVGW